MKCIYCGEEDDNRFNTKEHVIMRSFGTFGSQTPTLKCVCDDCNSFFKKELDLPFARNSLEGIMRYNNGIYSREKRSQDKNYLLLTLPKSEEFSEWGGVVIAVDGTTGMISGPIPQVQFKNETGEYEPILDYELEKLDWKSKKYSDKDIKIFAISEENHQELIDKLGKIGINYKIKSTLKPDFIEKYQDKKISVNIQGSTDHKMKRAIVKILFNFSAKFLGYEEVMKQEWNKAREYIRYNKEPLKARATNQPFWGEETKKRRYLEGGYNIRIENRDNSIIGVIQFFNLYLYEFILIENYSINKDMEACYKFIPGKEPIIGKKYRAIEVNGRRIPIIE